MKIDFTNYPWQAKIWNSDKRFLALCAGVQGGKTTFGAVWMINEMHKRGKGQYLIVAPTYKMLNQSTLTKFQEIVPRGWGQLNKSDMTFVTKDGRIAFLRGADNPESIEGITAKAIWADEASLMKPNIWLMMQGRVSQTQGRILLTFTPLSMNWVYKDIYLKRKEGEKEYEFVRYKNVDAPHFPKEEYERAKRVLTDIQFKMRYGGEFAKLEGLVYPGFNTDHIIDPFEIPEDWDRKGGVDWGFNNPFVALKGAKDSDDVLYVYDEFYQSRVIEHEQHLDEDICYFADPSGKYEIESLRAKGFQIESANNDVLPGIDKVNERINTGRLKVFKTCRNTIEEFELYQFQEGKDRPIKENDHAMDALRYMVMGYEDYVRPEIFVA